MLRLTTPLDQHTVNRITFRVAPEVITVHHSARDERRGFFSEHVEVLSRSRTGAADP